MKKIVHNNKYYKANIILIESEYKIFKDNLLNIYKKIKVHVPEEGFENEQEFDTWLQKFYDVRDKAIKSKISSDKLPPIYKIEIIKFLETKGYKYSDKKMIEFLRKDIFFNIQSYREKSFNLEYRSRLKTRDVGLYIEILPWTTKKDIVDDWKTIQKEQTLHYGGKVKNKKQGDFKRDYAIYLAYKKQKLDNEIQKIKMAADKYAYSKIYKKYGNISLQSIKKIYSKVKDILEP